jgi:hypothetical protein
VSEGANSGAQGSALLGSKRVKPAATGGWDEDDDGLAVLADADDIDDVFVAVLGIRESSMDFATTTFGKRLDSKLNKKNTRSTILA